MIEINHPIEDLAEAFQRPESKWRLFEALGYKPGHEEIIRFHNSMAKVKVARAPSRSGKSYSAAHDMIGTCLTPNTRSWCVGTSYHLAEKEFRVIHDQLVLNRDKLGIPKPDICHTNARSGSLFIKWPWGAILEGKSADNPDSLLGEAIHHVIYSEAAQLPRKIRERYVRQRLGTTGGRELVPTTPAEAAEWVKELDDQGRTGEFPWIESFHWPVNANPEFDQTVMDEAIAEYGLEHPMIREQFFGEWTFYGGRVYTQFQQESHVIEPFNIPASWDRYRGIDFGHRDPFVCLWVAVGPQAELYVYREYYQREGVSTREHGHHIKETSRDERYRLTVGDPSSAQLIEDLNHEGLTIVPGNNDRAAGRIRLTEYLSVNNDGVAPFNGQHEEGKKYPRIYVFNTCKETIREFMYYRWREGKAVEGEREKTEGEDHAMDTLRYICMERPSPTKYKKKVKPFTFKWELDKRRKPKYSNGFIKAHG